MAAPPVTQPDLTLKMLNYVRDIIKNITVIKHPPIKELINNIQTLIPILSLNPSLSQQLLSQLTKIYEIYIEKNEQVVTDYILANRETLIPNLTKYITLVKKGMKMYNDYASAIDKRMHLSRQSAKHISQLSEVALYIHCHGLCTIQPLKQPLDPVKQPSEPVKLGFEPVNSGIPCFKFTSAPLCMVENSSSAQDKYIADFFLILDEHYKTLTRSETNPAGESIFTNNINSIIVANYFICKFYKDYTCNMYKHVPEHCKTDAEYGMQIIQEYDHAIQSAFNDGFLFTYPISNPASYEKLPYIDESGLGRPSLSTLLQSRTGDRSTDPYPSRVTITSPDVEPNIQRNKVYTVEDTPGSASLDIIILTSFKFNFLDSPEILVAAGDSLLTLLLKLNTDYPEQMSKMIGLYRNKYPPPDDILTEGESEGLRAYNFTEAEFFNNMTKGSKKTITSTSLRFILFFFEQIGANKATIFDFSCGVLDFTPEGEDQPDDTVCDFQKLGPTQPSQSQQLTEEEEEEEEEEEGEEEEEEEKMGVASALPNVLRKRRLLLDTSDELDKSKKIATGGMAKSKSYNKNKTKRRNKTNRKTTRRKINKTKRRNTKRRNIKGRNK